MTAIMQCSLTEPRVALLIAGELGWMTFKGSFQLKHSVILLVLVLMWLKLPATSSPYLNPAVNLFS